MGWWTHPDESMPQSPCMIGTHHLTNESQFDLILFQPTQFQFQKRSPGATAAVASSYELIKVGSLVGPLHPYVRRASIFA